MTQTGKSAIRKGSKNVVSFEALKAYREQGKAVKPKGNKAKRHAINDSVTRRFPGTYQDNIAAVGMR
jgi:hypothetical protein